MAENTQTQLQINTLRTLQESYDALVDAQSAQATATALEAAKQAILDAINTIDIDTSDLAKEATLGDVASVLEYMEQGGMPEIENIAKQGTNPEATLSKVQAKIDDTQAAVSALPTLQDILNAGIVPISYDGIEMADGVTIDSPFDLITKRNSIVRITDNAITTLPQVFNQTDFTSLLEFNGYAVINAYRAFTFSNTLRIVRVPNIAPFNSIVNTFVQAKELRIIDLSNMSNEQIHSNTFTNALKIIDIICGANFNGSTSVLVTWSPTEALLNNSASLVEQGETFTSNLEKLLYNIREHIAANLPTITAGYSITFSAAVKAAILADQPTADAFTNKGWTIA